MPSRLARAIVRLAAILLPDGLEDWGMAMRHEVEAIRSARGRIGFATGCLGVALGQSIRFHLMMPLIRPFVPSPSGDYDMRLTDLLLMPRLVAAGCAVVATGAGLAHMSMAGAPMRYLVVNAGALLLGFLAVAIITLCARSVRLSTSVVSLGLAVALLLASLLGTSAEGATRWLVLGGVVIQPSLIILPFITVGFARNRNWVGAAALMIVAIALALQPDRAMAGALLAALLALAALHPQRSVLTALGAAVLGFATAMMQPDTQGAMPFVDQILYTALAISPLAGLCVLGGSVLLVAPALLGFAGKEHRESCAVFGAVWLAIVAAAALGNYPTPLVGFGGSAIIGYVIALLGLPKGMSRVRSEPHKTKRGAANGLRDNCSFAW